MKKQTKIDALYSNIFDFMYEPYRINKPIRLIEFFAGYGSQALALKYLNEQFESWKICEWAIKSIQAYKDLHFPSDNTDYCNGMTNDEVIDALVKKGVSIDYNSPATRDQIKKQNYRSVYNNIIATHNLVNIQNVKGEDLEIIDTDKYEYVLTYSFPCQDLSLAGNQKGMSDTSTRSGMLWEVERILFELHNQDIHIPVLLMENVPDVHSNKNLKDFTKWIKSLESIGYKNYWQDLNAKDYGIPQNRERCFMISIQGENNYVFPKPFELKLRLKDMLEKEVDEKYYLSDAMIKYISFTGTKNFKNPDCKINLDIARPLTTDQNKRAGTTNYISEDLPDNFDLKEIAIGDYRYDEGFRERKDGLCPTLPSSHLGTASISGQPLIVEDTNKIIVVGKTKSGGERSAILDEDGICSCLTATDYKQPKQILIKNATKQGYLVAEEGDGIDISGRMEYHRGTVQKGIAQTIKTSPDIGVVVKTKNGVQIPLYKNTKQLRETIESNELYEDNPANLDLYNRSVREESQTIADASHNSQRLWDGLQIRKLTPRECGRLMAVSDSDITKMSKNQSNSSLYHLFGDSIVVNVLMEIFKMMM